MIKELRYYVQKILPLVYDDSLSYMELLNKVVYKLNETIKVVNDVDENITEQVKVIMNEWIEDGTFEELINETVLENLNSRITTAENDIDTLEDNVNTLEGETSSLDERLDSAEGSISTLNSDVTELQGEAVSLDGRLDSAEGSISALNSDVTELKNNASLVNNRRYIVMSDSYGLVRNEVVPWTTILKGLLNASDTDYYNFSAGSMGFNVRGDSGYNAQELLAANVANVSSPSTITDIIVAMGANDVLATTGLDTAIIYFINYAKTQFINAKIHIGFIGNTLDKTGAQLASHMSALMQYSSACQMSDAIEISGCSAIMHNARNVQSDGVHPNSDGANAIARFINEYLNGGRPVYKAFATCSITSQYFLDPRVTECIDGDITSIHLNITDTASQIDFTNRYPVEIGTINNPIVRCVAGAPLNFIVRTFKATTLEPIILSAQIYNGKVYLSSADSQSVSVSANIATYPDNSCLPTDMA